MCYSDIRRKKFISSYRKSVCYQVKMDSSKNISKTKKNRRKVVNIRCRKISSNKSYLSSSSVSGYKHRVKVLLKTNKDLASALQDVRCDLENCKKDLNKIQCARIKMFEMHSSLKYFMRNFEEVLMLLNTDESNWLFPGFNAKSHEDFKKKTKCPIEPIEEVSENESMIEEHIDVDKLTSALVETADSSTPLEPTNSASVEQTFVTPVLQSKDGKKLANNLEEIDFTFASAEEENEDSATPKLILSSPIIIKLTSESIPHRHLQDNILPPSQNITDLIPDSSSTSFPIRSKISKIPRMFGINRAKQTTHACKIPGKGNKSDKIMTYTDCPSKLSESNLSEIYDKITENVPPDSKSVKNSDKHDDVLIKNTDNGTKRESNSSRRKTYVKIPETLDSSFITPGNSEKVSNPKEISLVDIAFFSPVPASTASHRKTFVVAKTENLEEPHVKKHDKRKTFIKKTLNIDKKCISPKNRRDTFTVSQSKDDSTEKCCNQSKNNNFAALEIENVVQNKPSDDFEAILSPDLDTAVETTIMTVSESCYSSMKCDDLPLVGIAVSQNNALEPKSNRRSSNVEETTNAKTFHNEEQFIVQDNVARENLSNKFEDIVDNPLPVIQTIPEFKESKLENISENVDFQSKNESNEFIINKKKLVTEVNLYNVAKNLKDLQINIQRDDSLTVVSNSTNIEDQKSNEFAKILPNLQNENQRRVSIKMKENPTKVRKSLLNRATQNFKDLQKEIQTESDDIQVLENLKATRDSRGSKRYKQISYKDFLSSDSDVESLPNIDDIIKEVPSVKATPIRGQISKTKCKKIFVFKKRKSAFDKRVSKSKASKDNDIKPNKVGYHDTENDSSVNPTENSTKPRKSVTFAVNTEDKTNIFPAKIPEKKNRKSSIMKKEFQMPIINEEITGDFMEIYKESGEPLNNSYSSELSVNNAKENIIPKQGDQFISCQNVCFEHIYVENENYSSKAEFSGTDLNKKSKPMKSSKKGETIRKRKSYKDVMDCNPKKSKKSKVSPKARKNESKKDAASENVNMMKSNFTKDTAQGKISENETKRETLKNVAQNDQPEKNTFVVSAEVHPPPRFLETEIKSKHKKKPVGNHKKLSVVLNNVFESESIDILNVSRDKDDFVNGRTSFALKSPLSSNLSNIQPVIARKSKVNLVDCEGLKSKRGRKLVSYKEPSLNMKLRR